MKLNVNLGKDSYPIYIEQGILNKTKELISQVFTGAKIVIVSDDNVFPLYGEQIVNQLKDTYEVFMENHLRDLIFYLLSIHNY